MIFRLENRQLEMKFIGARDFSPENISIGGTSVFGFAYAVTGKSPAPKTTTRNTYLMARL